MGFLRVKGPLIPFKKDSIQHCGRIREYLGQEFVFFSPFFLDGKIAWNDLLIATRKIPARMKRGDTILPFRQVYRWSARHQRRTHAAQLAGRINAGGIKPRAGSHSIYHGAGQKIGQLHALPLQRLEVKRRHTLHRAVRRQKPHRLIAAPQFSSP